MRSITLNRPVRAAALFLTAMVGVAGIVSMARADKYPEPSPYPISWQLKFTHGTPKRIVVDVPGTTGPAAYWYLTYTVQNNTDKTMNFVPNFDLVDDDGKAVHADRALPPEVFRQVKKQDGNRLLEDRHHIEGPLNPGEDEAKDGVAIWPEPKLHMGSFRIFVGGLSGEYVEMKDKDGKYMMVRDEETGKDLRVVVRKTLELDYHVVGDAVMPGADDDHTTVDKWIMR